MARQAFDWEAIEREYRAGIRSLRDIAAEFGPSHVAIAKRAKKEGWVRDLAGKIKAAARAQVNKEAVTGEVNTVTKTTEREIVEANATMQAGIIREHRRDITRFRALVLALLKELEAQAEDPELFEKLGELVTQGADKIRDAYNRVLSLPSRVDTVKKLADALKTLVVLERQAFGLDEEGPEEKRKDVHTMSRQELEKIARGG